MFVLGETMYRAALPHLRSSWSDMFLSRVRNASTCQVASLNRLRCHSQGTRFKTSRSPADSIHCSLNGLV
jgi:hypothetical protein